jgi:hypothetical protein
MDIMEDDIAITSKHQKNFAKSKKIIFELKEGKTV